MGISEIKELRDGSPSPRPVTAAGRTALAQSGGQGLTRGSLRHASVNDTHGSRVRYAGTELRRMQFAVGAYLAPYRLRVPTGEPFSGTLTATRWGDVVVASILCDVPIEAGIDAMPDSYLITLASQGTCRVIVDGESTWCGSYVVGAGQRVRVLWPAGASITMVQLSRRLVESVWCDQGGRFLVKPLRFTVPLARQAAQTRVWERFAAALVAAHNSSLPTGPTSVGTRFGRLLAQALLDLQPYALPQTASHREEMSGGDGLTAAPASLVRALNFCHAHAREHVSVADIADAAGIGKRTLQTAFRTHLGITPVQYLRQIRLAGVHADLQRIAAGSMRMTVTDVAQRWGFNHLGRFSGIYRAEFGRLPSQTARTAPQAWDEEREAG